MTVDTLETEFFPEPQDDNRTEWLKQRKTCIGGSDIAAVLGHSPYKSALAVYEDKLSETIDYSDNERMLWGRLNEDAIAQEVARRLECKVHRKNDIIRHKDYPYCGVTIDRRFVIGYNRPSWMDESWQRVGLEIKTAGVDQRRGWIESGPPPYYLDQCQWCLYVTGWDAWVLACLFGGNELRTWIILRDPEWEAYASYAASSFWADVQLRNPPPPSGNKCDTEIIARYFPHTIPLSEAQYEDRVERWVEQYNNASDDIKRCEKLKEHAKQEIQLMLGDNESMRLPDGRGLITWKADKNGLRNIRVP